MRCGTAAFLFCLFTGLGACGPRLVIDNRSSGRVFIRVDAGLERTIENGTTLEIAFDATPFGPVTATSLIGAGYYLRDFTNRLALKGGVATDLRLIADVGRLRLVNRSESPLVSIFMSTSSNALWGESVGALPAGDRTNLAWRAAEGLWDLRVVKSTGENYYYGGIQVSNGKTTAITFETNKFSVASPALGERIE
jgi:hypothetical protein